MSPLNHKRTTSSLAPPIICVAEKLGIKRQKVPHLVTFEICNLATSVCARSLGKVSLAELDQESPDGVRAGDIDFCYVRLG